MTKKYFREFITNLMPSVKPEEEREIIIREVMKYIGTSILSTKISQYDDKGHVGVFYDTKDARFFRDEIKDYLSKRVVPKRENPLPPQGGLEKEVKKRGRPRKIPEEYEEEPNQIPIKEACKYLEKKYDIGISPEDLKKIMQEMQLTKQSLDDAHKFGMYNLTPAILVPSNLRKYEVTINNKKGVPRYFCERESILHGLLKKKS